MPERHLSIVPTLAGEASSKASHPAGKGRGLPGGLAFAEPGSLPAEGGPDAGEPATASVRQAVVLSVDPGGTTGWSLFVVHPEALTDPEVSILDNVLHWSHGQLPRVPAPFDKRGENAVALALVETVDAWLDEESPVCVVIEDFIPQSLQKGRDFLSPVRITEKIDCELYRRAGLPVARGAVNLFAGVRQFIQMPSLAMSAVTDDRLRAWGFYEREGGLQHARDADRHSLTFLKRCKEDPRLARMAWSFCP